MYMYRYRTCVYYLSPYIDRRSMFIRFINMYVSMYVYIYISLVVLPLDVQVSAFTGVCTSE